ncbi:hypothetical protein WJX84_010064 [Apatococcus fuscideae]|uniref:Peptidase A2 domain-containing protein n=1 Tax=Apatococcus fuscideae TaxID=2026836 RepID=A0AAW1T5M3_9CHLO
MRLWAARPNRPDVCKGDGADSNTVVATRSDLHILLQQARSAIGWQHLNHQEVVVSGSGQHLGEPVAWQLRWRGDGAFAEEIKGRHLSFRWGFEGSAAGATWEEDSSGVSKKQELDDREAMLLSVWVRTGYWLHPEAAPGLDIQAASLSEARTDSITSSIQSKAAAGSHAADQGCTSAEQLSKAVPAPSHSDRLHDNPASPAGEVPSDGIVASPATSPAAAVGSGDSRCLQLEGQASADSGAHAAPVSTTGSSQGHQEAPTLCLQLRGAKMVATLRLEGQSHLPQSLSHPICGQQEDWAYHDWQSWDIGGDLQIMHPRTIKHRAAAGGDNEYLVERVRLQSLGLGASAYSMPPVRMLPADTAFEQGPEQAQAQCWWTSSGHLLLHPAIDGQRLGWMLLDTGASGGVITKAAADKLGLERFGDLHVSGVGASVTSRFCQATSIQIGPMTMAKPLFMEMDISGLVSGAPGEIIGILGADVLRRAVWELPAKPTPPQTSWGKAKAPPLKVHMWHPAHPQALPTGLPWQTFISISSLPHIPVRFGLPEAKEGAGGPNDDREALFMLDSGAGGADVMMNLSSGTDLDLLDPKRNSSISTTVRGVGGTGGAGMKMARVQLPWAQLGQQGAQLQRVSCLIAQNTGLELSMYTAGIVCSSLMGRCRIYVDYTRSRIAFLPPIAPSKL